MSEDHLVASMARREWLVDGILAPLVDSYVNFLRAQRYSDSTIETYLHGLAHFAFWAHQEGFGLDDIGETTIAHFIQRHLPACNCPPPCVRYFHGISPPLKHLLVVMRQAGCANEPLATPIDKELVQFRHFLLGTCGFAEATVYYRTRHIRDFLTQYFGADTVAISQLTPADIGNYIAKYAKRWRPASLPVIRGSLKSYLRFRGLCGDHVEPLIVALPELPNWKHAMLPTALNDSQLDRFLHAFDLTRSVGLRDYAIARCLVDLGLRGNEVAVLALASVDWRNGVLTVAHGKGRRIRQLPLPRQTGEALARYLRDARPITNSRALFVHHEAPVGQPLSVAAIRSAMRYAFERCGLGDQFCSTHVLRRTAAIRLQRSGASLKEIADVLGHRSLESTTRYARVDLEGLRAVALPWPGSES